VQADTAAGRKSSRREELERKHAKITLLI